MKIYFTDQFEDESNFDIIASTDDDGSDPTFAARVAINNDEGMRILIKVHSSAGHSCFKDARCVEHIAYIGFGQYVFVFNTKTVAVTKYQLHGYFGHMYDGGDFEELPAQFSVLVTSASEALAFSRSGKLVWSQPNLGIDGVLLHTVDRTRICGDGEFDPPGGWQKFTVLWDIDTIA